ncbi:hypothetical protein L596_007037 [Steinernema carpocapsae]|uniref:BZIP domain-containing protein n=1 Tax=Steinernema carpocapsae TaxID=34508 RepID=A0A4U5P800_STECR|nr:hypothetical protein L596_007037 [Steinernema carpocapsae]
MSDLLRRPDFLPISSGCSSSSSITSPTHSVIQSPLSLKSFLETSSEPYQKKRGRPRSDDRDVVLDATTPEAEKQRIIYKRTYARNYREKIRADLEQKDELRQALAKVEDENRRLRETLMQLKQENHEILKDLLSSTTLIQQIAVLQSQLASTSSSNSL